MSDRRLVIYVISFIISYIVIESYRNHNDDTVITSSNNDTLNLNMDTGTVVSFGPNIFEQNGKQYILYSQSCKVDSLMAVIREKDTLNRMYHQCIMALQRSSDRHERWFKDMYDRQKKTELELKLLKSEQDRPQ